MENQRIIQVEDKVPFSPLVPLNTQHMFVMFGASVLVPSMSGINPAVVPFINGMGTLLFIGVTKGRASAYLGFSFAFLMPTGMTISNFGYEYILGGFVAIGFCGCILVFIVYKFGTEWIKAALPSAAMDPVVTLIGLGLSGFTASNAGLLDEALGPRKATVLILTLGVAVFGFILFGRFFSVIFALIAVIVGYVSVLACSIVDFAEVVAASVFALPNFSMSKFNLEVITTILPALLIITSEYIGHQVVTNKIVGRDLLKDSGLHRSLFGDNFSIMISGLIGFVPTTTYGENIGVMAITRVYSVRVIARAAALSIVCFFIGRFSTLISTIPGPVIDGISFLLYGMTGTSDLRILVDPRMGYENSRNLAPASVIFVIGLSRIAVKFGNVQLAGMVLTCAVGMTLSLVFYVLDYFRLTNGQ